LLTQGAPVLERIFAWILMPFLRRIVYSALYCNKPGAQERSLQVVEAIFKESMYNLITKGESMHFRASSRLMTCL
jgi:hypothetical protein